MIRVEFSKQVRRLRTYLVLGICVVIPAIITMATKVGGPHEPMGPTSERLANQADFFRLATRSGLSMPLAALTAMSGFLLPIVVALFCGEAVAGEAGWGTLRYLLVRPVTRRRLLGAKLSVAAMLCLLATVLVALTGLVAGLAAFGWHPMLTPSSTTLPEATALARVGLATVYVAWSMSGMATFAFLLSTMTDAPVGAIAGGVGLAIVSQILDGISALRGFRNWLPTHHWGAWDGLFVHPTQTADMVRGTLLQIPYVIVFCVVAWWWFARKDVLS
ncbi:MAG: ABC transporter permease subunit [Actinomycetota bacterium]